MFWIWLGIVISLSLIEIITINLTTIWFVASGLLSLVISLFINNYLIQFGIFVVVGFIFMILTKPYLVNKLNIGGVRTNLDRVIDMVGVVTKKITKNEPGEVKVDGKKWMAISNKDIELGNNVLIKKIEGVKLIVEEVD